MNTATPPPIYGIGKRNAFRTLCAHCNRMIDPDGGELLPKEDLKRWRVVCDGCAQTKFDEAEARRQQEREADEWIARMKRQEAEYRRQAAEEADRLLYDRIIQARLDQLRRQQAGCLSILGLTPPVTADDVRRAYREKALRSHPDHGGDPAAFVTLKRARDEAMSLCGGAA